jgi:ABC transporter with metal-binding/Fe-S-binding domain ATP-binding protein
VATALVSGGKDSVYSAYLSDSQGWDVDELLVIVPQDIDSFLFHTPNLDLVRLQAEAWGKRVREVRVEGTGEEVESAALRTALSPGTGPVVVGAIGSSYQWGRVSRLSFELGRPLYAPLWGKEPGRVVREEISAGLDIRFVQVAAEPLGPELLGRRLGLALLEELERIGRERRAVHVAGEGGEYETLVVDAPFFDRRIVIDESRVTERGLAARLSITKAHLEAKPPRGAAPGPEGQP